MIAFCAPLGASKRRSPTAARCQRLERNNNGNWRKDDTPRNPCRDLGNSRPRTRWPDGRESGYRPVLHRGEAQNGIAGACATPIKTIPEAVCCPTSVIAMPFPGKLRGRPALDLAKEALGDHGIRRAVGIAAMNALADACWRRRPHPETELRLGVDAFDATEMRPGDKVVVVGAFVPFLRELKRRRQPFLVLEKDPA